MPVEIKELIVRFNVTENSSGIKNNSERNQITMPTYKNIVRECTEQVLKSLERKTER